MKSLQLIMSGVNVGKSKYKEQIEYIVEVISPRGAVEVKSFDNQEDADVFAMEREYEEWTVSSWKEFDGKIIK